MVSLGSTGGARRAARGHRAAQRSEGERAGLAQADRKRKRGWPEPYARRSSRRSATHRRVAVDHERDDSRALAVLLYGRASLPRPAAGRGRGLSAFLDRARRKAAPGQRRRWRARPLQRMGGLAPLPARRACRPPAPARRAGPHRAAAAPRAAPGRRRPGARDRLRRATAIGAGEARCPPRRVGAARSSARACRPGLHAASAPSRRCVCDATRRVRFAVAAALPSGIVEPWFRSVNDVLQSGTEPGFQFPPRRLYTDLVNGAVHSRAPVRKKGGAAYMCVRSRGYGAICHCLVNSGRSEVWRMSTKPKLDDQTQAALSAIEEALKGTRALGRAAPARGEFRHHLGPATLAGRHGSRERRQVPLRHPPRASSVGSYSPPTSGSFDPRRSTGRPLEARPRPRRRSRPRPRPMTIAR